MNMLEQQQAFQQRCIESERQWREQQVANQAEYQKQQAERERQWRQEDIRRTKWDIAVKIIGPVVGAVIGAILGGTIAWLMHR